MRSSSLVLAEEAVSSGARLILLPKAVLTGLANKDDPVHDLPLGQPIPGPATDRLGAFTRRQGVWLGFGLLERAGDTLYDSAVLLGPDGSIVLTYRDIFDDGIVSRFRALRPEWLLFPCAR